MKKVNLRRPFGKLSFNAEFRAGSLLRAMAISALVVNLTAQAALATNAAGAPKSFLSSTQVVNDGNGIPADPVNTPVSRGFITVDATSAIGGADVDVQIYQAAGAKGEPVTLSLQVVVTSNAGTYVVPVKLLEKDTVTPNSYHTKRTYHLDYAELQTQFATLAPKATGLKIEPGVAFFVKADFGKNGAGHDWGGVLRGGGFFLPVPKDAQGRLMVELLSPKAAQSHSAGSARPTALDLAYPIVPELTNLFNDRTTGAGLKKGGQIGSRVEGEGKFQLSEAEFDKSRADLFALAKDPALATQVLGPGWKITVKDRYMKRDASTQQLILDAKGFPIPDPMVDTYYDDDNYRAASKDVALRYRYTAANGAGSWNLKPGDARVDAEGISYRNEFEIQTTDSDPSSIKAFLDSTHPLNPGKLLRTKFPNEAPSSFLKPSVRLDDNRYKFLIENSNNLAIEISVDEVTANDLRHGRPPAKFHQVEMDIEHLAVNSANTVAANSGGYQYLPNNNAGNGGKWNDSSVAAASRTAFMAGLDDSAFFDGRPVLHDKSDLAENSPLLQLKKRDFDDATKVIVALRNHMLGATGWRPGGQKYAYAAAALNLVDGKDLGPSVKGIASTDLTRDRALRVQQHGPSCSIVFKQNP